MEKVIKNNNINSGTGYCKMPDGTLMCWGMISFLGANTSQWGELYLCNINPSISFPIKFISNPSVTMTEAGMYSCFVVTANSDKNGIGDMQLARASQFNTTATYYISWQAIGRWK